MNPMFQDGSKISKSDVVPKSKKSNNTSTKTSGAESLPVPQKMTMEKPPMAKKNKAGNRRQGGAGFKIPGGDDGFSLSSFLGEDSSDDDDTTDKIPFDVAYPKTHVHTPNPIEYAQMKDALRAAEYERITREKEKRDWSELHKSS